MSIAVVSCSNSTYYTMTGHTKQADIIEHTFQTALEYNADGIISYWHDKTTGKSGHIQPIYASYQWKGPCRKFEMAYYYPTKSPTYHYGIACRRDQVWQIH